MSKPKPVGRNVRVELDLSDYAIKSDLENATGHLISLKRKVDKSDIGKLKTIQFI